MNPYGILPVLESPFALLQVTLLYTGDPGPKVLQGPHFHVFFGSGSTV